MKKKYIKYYFFILASSLFGSFINNETGWEYVQGTEQGFYTIQTINIDGEEAFGDNGNAGNTNGECASNPYTCDVIGAFVIRDETTDGVDISGDGEITSDAELCVGWQYASSAGYITIPMIGVDPIDPLYSSYIEPGEVPILKIYDHSNHSILLLDPANISIFETFLDCNETDCELCLGYSYECIDNGVWDDEFVGEPFTDCDIGNDVNICDGDEGWTDDMGNGLWDDSEFDDANGNGVCDPEELDSWYDDDYDGFQDVAESFVDCNSDVSLCDGDAGWDEGMGNGVYDPPVAAEWFDDQNNNGIWDGYIDGQMLGWEFNSNDIYYGSLDATNIFGCKDSGDYSGVADSYTCPIDGDFFLDLEECSDNCNIECEPTYQLLNLWESQYGSTYIDLEACNNDTTYITTADDGTCIYPPFGNILIEHEVIDGNNLEVSWSDPEFGDGPFYHNITILDGTDEVYNQFDPVPPIYIENLNYSTNYTIVVVTTSSENCDELETTQTNVWTDLMPGPDQVVVEEAPVSGEGMIFFEWDAVNFASTYSIETNSEFDVFESDSIVSDTWYTHNELAPDTTIEYQVVAINAEGSPGLPSESFFGSTLPLSQVTLDTIVVGQAKLDLSWQMDNGLLEYNFENFIFDIYMDGDLIFEGRQGTHYTAYDLTPGDTLCFEVVPRIELLVDGSMQEFTSSQSNEPQCAAPADISGWSLLIEAELNAWGFEENYVIDEYNELGMKPPYELDGSCGEDTLAVCATDGYDSGIDIFEPPAVDDFDWQLSLSFPHPEWNIGIGGFPQDYFTTDIRELKDLSKSLEIWDAVLSCNAPGSGQLTFNFVEAGSDPIFVKWDDQYSVVLDESSIDYTYSTPGEYSDFKIIIGNQAPSIPLSLVATQSDTISRAMDLNWSASEYCSGSDEACNYYANRYPPSSYKIYRAWYDEIEPHLIGFSGTSENRISFFPQQLYAPTEDMFEIVQQPVEGFIDSLWYEPYEDNGNGEYDLGESFIDCGWDGLCEGDPGYESEEYVDFNGNGIYDSGEEFTDLNDNGIWDENGADIGENDEVCNIVYYYVPYANAMSVDDSFSYSNGIYDLGETFVDCDEESGFCEGDEGWINTMGNNEWDPGETYEDSREIRVRLTENLEPYFLDIELTTGTVYNYNVTAVNDAGESELSIMDSEQTEDNYNPLSDAGLNQKRYLISTSQNIIECTFPRDNTYASYAENGQPIGPVCTFEDGCDYEGNYELGGPLHFGEVIPEVDGDGDPILAYQNNSYDPDGLPEEPLQYFWEIYDPNETLDNPQLTQLENHEADWYLFSEDSLAIIDLPETTNLPTLNYLGIEIFKAYLVRLQVKDVSDYPGSLDYITVQVTRDIPRPAQVQNVRADQSLYYIKIEWDPSSYEPDDPALEGYDGILELADEYQIYRDSLLLATVDSSVYHHIDSGLTPRELFIDLNENNTWDEGEIFVDENNNGVWDEVETHNYFITAVNSTGAADPSEEHTFSTGQLPIPVITAPTGGEILPSGDTTRIAWDISSSNIQFISSIGVYHSDQGGLEGTWVLLEEWNFPIIPVFFDFEVPVTDTISFYNKFKIEAIDIGDFGDVPGVAHDDITDHLIIIANDNLQNSYPPWMESYKLST